MGIIKSESIASREKLGPSLGSQRALLYEDQLGTICHRAIAWLLTYDLPLDESAAVRATDSVLAERIAPVYRASIRTWVSGAVVRYGTRFRRSTAWRFLGAEAIIEDVALDLLWVSSRGRIEADELKTGTSPAGRLAASITQAAGQAQAAAAVLGPGFGGVRLVVLNSPELSVMVAPDGSTRPIVPARAS